MKTVFTPDHILHSPAQELADGRFIDYFEKPSRAEIVLKYVTEAALGPVIAPTAHDDSAIKKVHDAGYLAFLEGAWGQAQAEGYPAEQTFLTASVSNLYNVGVRAPELLAGKLGYYLGDGCVPITATTWKAVRASADVALTAADLVRGGERSAFALCRPPGHHATYRVAGGYCFINNAAAAAQSFLDAGAKRVAILDIDYHHGNGTQDIFYARNDVLCVSVHADPAVDYPFFMGYEEERGIGAGEGFNLNYALPLGTDYAAWVAALEDGIAKIKNYGPDVLIVSLGLDTFKDDPISQFKLESGDYPLIGALIEKMGLPTLFVMEGGYAIDALGINTANVLKGFVGA